MTADRARVLLEINNAVVSHLDLAEVLNAISACLRREIQHDFAALALYDAELNELRLHALNSPADKDFMQRGQVIPLVGTPAALAFSTRKPVLRHHVDLAEFHHPIMQKVAAAGIQSGCAVPLICHDKIVGSMMLASLKEAAFSESDVELLGQIGVQAAIAVENARNFERARQAQQQVTQERDRSRLLLETNNAVVSHLDLKELLRSISASLHRIIHHDAAFLTLFDATGTRLRVHAFDLQSSEKGPFDREVTLSLEATPEGEAIRLGRPVLIPHRAELARFSDAAIRQAEEVGIHSGCAIPLMVQGRPLGAMSVVSFHEHAFSLEDARLLEQCSSQIAIAVQNALNFESAREAEQQTARERDRSQLLLEINNALVSHLDLRELVRAISISLKHVIPHDFVGMSIHDPESGKFFAQAADSELRPMSDGIFYDPEGTVGGRSFKTGKPVYIPRLDPQEFSSPLTRSFWERGLRTLYSVPLTVHGRILGIMSISSLREDAFSPHDRELFQAIARQVAIATANALAVRDLEALKNRLAQEKLYLEDEIRTELNFDEIVGQSPALREVLRLVETVANSDSTVLLLGETGTGKELVARAVHEHSRRQARTFVKLNCAAIPTGLLESELFGHEKGAFTGAIAQKIGRLELADQGTLFLDEVGDIPVEIQPKLLRALQEREFERLGSTHTKKVNVRLVAATNRNLEKMIEERQFRSDLYYRLNVFPIRIPPLRERREDIPLLVRYFAERFSRQMQKPIDSIPSEAMARLQAWDWPGNVRELENLIERSVILSTGSALQIPLSEMKAASPVSIPASVPDTSLETTDRDHIIKVLRETRGILAGPNGAASRLGLKRTTLQYKIKKLGITRDHWWPSAL
ncbi:MAG: sigma 54-interacting transcriptional regulator [Acidobacteria bacterium]|nr:sigma 54-interacting transcriptional regulator [Acidobacteriota bacterium]